MNNNNNGGGSSSHFTFTMSDGNGNIRTFSNNNGIPQNNNNANNNGDDPFAAFNHPFFQQNNPMSGMGGMSGMSGFNHPFFRNNNNMNSNNNQNPLNDQFGSMRFQPMMHMNIINNLMMGDGGGFGAFQFGAPRPRVANQENIDASTSTDTYKTKDDVEKKEDDNSNNMDETTEKEENKKKETCSICLEPFKNGDEIRRLPCFHIFHKNEIDRWLTTGNDKCPICRVPINGQVQNQ